MDTHELTFEQMRERRHAEKAEAVRFAKAGLGVHDSELVYADDFEALMVRVGGPDWERVQDEFQAGKERAAREWTERQPCPACQGTGTLDREDYCVICPVCKGERKQPCTT